MSDALIYSTGVARYALCIPWLLSLGRFIDKRKRERRKKEKRRQVYRHVGTLWIHIRQGYKASCPS